MNVDHDEHDHDHDHDPAIVTPAQSKEYEEAALEKLWNGAWTEPEWNALAAMEVSSLCCLLRWLLCVASSWLAWFF
jgi:hypothetical protein